MDLPGLLTEIAFRHLWQGATVIGIVSLLICLSRAWSAEHRSWLWTACLILSAALPFVTLVNLPALKMGALGALGGPAGGAVSLAEGPAPAMSADIMSPLTMLFAWLPFGLILSLLAGIWAGVVVWKLFAFAAAARRTRHVLDTLEPCALSTDMLPPNWPEEIAVMQSSAVKTPMAIGLTNCRVVLPSSLVETLPQHQLRHVLSHELAHIRRGDLQFAVIQRLIEAVFWWSPVTWFIGLRLREEREMACDDRAVQMNGCSRQYATALLESVTVLVTNRQRGQADMLAMSAFDHQSRDAFRTRIRRLIGKGYSAHQSMNRLHVTGVSLAAGAVLAVFVLSPRGVFDTRSLSPERPYVTAGLETEAGVYFGDLSLPLPGHTARIQLPTGGSSEGLTRTIERIAHVVPSRTTPQTPPTPTPAGFPEAPEPPCGSCTNAIRLPGKVAMKTRARNSGPSIEIETIEFKADVDVDVDVEERTEVVISSVEGDKVIKRIIRHSDARSITITSHDGTTMTMTIDADGNLSHAYAVSGGTGEIVSIQ